MSTSQPLKNRVKDKKKIEDIFKPGKSIEVVFDIDSHSPVVRSSIIYECDYASSRMIIAQTDPKILPGMLEKPIDVTALVEEELGVKFRGGIKCRVVKFINDYRLFKDKVTQALMLVFSSDWRNVNIRSAYRLEPNNQYKVDAKLEIDGIQYLSEKHLKVSNISFTGIGLLIPKKLKQERNSLLDINVGANVGIELILNEKQEEGIPLVITADITVVRVLRSFNEKSGYIGAKFRRLTSRDEAVLSKFIHNAQMYIIRKSNRL